MRGEPRRGNGLVRLAAGLPRTVPQPRRRWRLIGVVEAKELVELVPDVFLASAEVTQVDGQVGECVLGGLGEPVRVSPAPTRSRPKSG